MTSSHVDDFVFHGPLCVDDLNGLIQISGFYLPDDILCDILSYASPTDLLRYTLVCKRWCNIIKSSKLWMKIYNRIKYPKKAKKLPWYVFYCYFATDNFKNLLKNNCGQYELSNWKIMGGLEDNVFIEKPIEGCEPLPDVPEIGCNDCCFEHRYGTCWKVQEISLEEKRLLRYIMNKFVPHIYVSEWTATSYGSRSCYRLFIKGFESTWDKNENLTKDNECAHTLFYRENVLLYDPPYNGGLWSKVEILLKEYPANVRILTFENLADYEHQKKYSCKMTGGVVKFIFDSIQPLQHNGIDTAVDNPLDMELASLTDRRTWSAKKFDWGIIGLTKGRLLRGNDRKSPPLVSCCCDVIPYNPKRDYI